MKVRLIPLLTCCVSFFIWSLSGCETSETGKSEEAYRPGSIQDSKIEDSTKSQSNDLIKMEEIWKLREQDKCEDLVEAVDIFLQAKKRDQNTKGTLLFLKGDSQRQLGKFEESKRTFGTFIAECNNARYLDPNAVLHIHDSNFPSKILDPNDLARIPLRPECNVGLRLVAEGDKCSFPESSNDFTELAWKYLNKNRFDTSIFFAWECIRRFRSEAESQQKVHKAEYGKGLPSLSPEPEKNKKILKKYWALYDVGTCCFIVGQAFEYQADNAVNHRDVQEARKLYNKATTQYKVVMTEYPSAQCFDPEGPWYWSVKEGAEEHINWIEDEKLKKMGG